MFGTKLKEEVDKGIVFSNRVLMGNWYESARLDEHKLNMFLDQMKKGNLMLARYRRMTENLLSPAQLTMTTGPVAFGSKVCLKAPYVPSCDPPVEGKTGIILGGRISSDEIHYSQDLEDGCDVVGVIKKNPTKRACFTVMSADYCDRAAAGEPLKYNQEFMLALTTSIERKKPLYLRYDPNAIPGINGPYPLYLSLHPVTNARWRILPVRKPDKYRIENEGKQVQINTDMIVNHAATNINLGVNVGKWGLGFYGKVCRPIMKTGLDIYGKELPFNIWNFFVPVGDNPQ